ncbi:MAG: hypothetical protein QHJ73_13415, partial [Armatimonadota bacterium]|nr:hypothetical protein [Armatimonadota bacterium]
VLFEAVRTYVGPLWLFREWPHLHQSLWPVWVLLFLAPALGALRGARRREKHLAADPGRGLFLAAAAALVTNLAGVVNTCLFKQWLMWIFAGRFLLTSLAGTMLLCVAGMAGWARSGGRQRIGMAAFSLFLALQNAWLIPAVWFFYHR